MKYNALPVRGEQCDVEPDQTCRTPEGGRRLPHETRKAAAEPVERPDRR